MNRRVALSAALPLLLGGAADVPATVPRITTGRCPGIAAAALVPPVRRLFALARETRAVLVLSDGCPLVRGYAPGYDDRTRFISWSMAKTITGLLIGSLVESGKLRLDAPAPIAEWHRPGDPRATITLRHLLQMASGLEHIEIGTPVERSDTNQTLFVSHPAAMAAAAIDHPLEAQPGTRFRYSSLTSLILAEIIARSLTPSRDPRVRAAAWRAFAQERLFGPAGITSAVAEFDGAGTQIGGSIIYMTLNDWGRLGMLLLDGRAADGRRVVDPRWLAFMKTPSPTNPEYGAQLWLNRPGGVDGRPTLFGTKGPATTVAADGHLGQLVIASPDSGPGRGLVVVRLGNSPENRGAALMSRLGDVVSAVPPKLVVRR